MRDERVKLFFSCLSTFAMLPIEHEQENRSHKRRGFHATMGRPFPTGGSHSHRRRSPRQEREARYVYPHGGHGICTNPSTHERRSQVKGRFVSQKELAPSTAVAKNWGPPRDGWLVIVHAFLAHVRVAILPHPCLGTSCWLWQGARDDDYGLFQLAGTKASTACRASWLIHRGPIPHRRWVLHKCDVKQCVNPDHLFLGNNRANRQDFGQKHRSGHLVLAAEYAASEQSNGIG